jgi:hypothetical protein
MNEITTEWWDVEIYGRGVGVVLVRYQAAVIAPGIYTVSIDRKRAMRDGWRDETIYEAHEEHEKYDDCDLELMRKNAYASEAAARNGAIEHFRSNSILLADALTDSLRENMGMIGTLSLPVIMNEVKL